MRGPRVAHFVGPSRARAVQASFVGISRARFSIRRTSKVTLSLSEIEEFDSRSGGNKERIMDKDVIPTPEPGEERNDPAKQPETFPGIRIEPQMPPPGQDEIEAFAGGIRLSARFEAGDDPARDRDLQYHKRMASRMADSGRNGAQRASGHCSRERPKGDARPRDRASGFLRLNGQASEIVVSFVKCCSAPYAVQAWRRGPTVPHVLALARSNGAFFHWLIAYLPQ